MSDKIDRYGNMEFDVDSGYLTIRICIDETKVDVQPSRSGKTFVLSTTGGAVRVPGTPLRLNMTLYRKP